MDTFFYIKIKKKKKKIHDASITFSRIFYSETDK